MLAHYVHVSCCHSHDAGTHIVGVRISSAGATAALLQQLLPVLQAHPVRTLQLEWDGDGDLASLLNKLRPLGFVEASHIGPICDARWAKSLDIVRNLPHDDAYPYAPQVDPQMVHKCRLTADAFADLDPKLLSSTKWEVVLLRRSPLWPLPS